MTALVLNLDPNRDKPKPRSRPPGGGSFPFDPPPFPSPPGVFQVGLNLSGLENNPGTQAPGFEEMSYWVSKGVTSFRIPLNWPSLQTTTFASLNSDYLALISSVLSAANSAGAKCIVDFHGFGSGPGGKIGSAIPISAFVDLWTKFSAALRADPHYSAISGYDLMNEWQGMDVNNPNSASTPASRAIILQANHDVLVALRNAGDNTRLYLEWDHFSGAWDSVTNNIEVLMDLALADPAKNSKVSVHCYLDRDSSGSHFVYGAEAIAEGAAPPGLSTNINIFPQRMSAITTLAASKQCPIHVGEMGWSSDALNLGGSDDYLSWNQAADTAFAYCQANNIEIHVWSAGPGFNDTYNTFFYGYNPSPSNVSFPGNKDFTAAGLQATQTVIIEKYTGYTGSQPLAYRVDTPFGVVPYASPGNPIPNYKLRYNGKIPGDKLFFPAAKLNDGTPAGGTFVPSVIDLGPGNNGLASFSYIPADTFPSINLSFTNNSGLIDPPAVGASSSLDFFSTVGSVAPNIYATRRLVNSYNGPAVKLQRAIDNAQMDFPFNNRGDLPRQAIQDWSNSRTIALVTWYDQSGNGSHQIYSSSAGVVLTLVDTDGYPSITWTSSALANVNTPASGTASMTIYSDVFPTNGGFIASQDNSADNYRLQSNFFGISPNTFSFSGSVSFGASLSNWNEMCATYSSLRSSNNLKSYLGGSVVQQQSCPQFTNATSANYVSIGNFQFADVHFTGSMRTLIIHYIEYTNTNVSALHSLRTTYFSTALPDSLSAVNPLITGAAPSKLFTASGSSTPFVLVNVTDGNSGSPTDSVTITLSGAAATLAGTGLSGSNPYTLSAASAATITTQLQGLVLSSAAALGSVININLQVNSSAGTSSSTSACVVTTAAYGIETAFTPPVGTFTPISYKGVHVQGGQLVPASYPSTWRVDYYSTKGFGVIRMPVHSTNLYPTPFSALSTSDLTAIKSVVDYCYGKNLRVIFDLHQFGKIWNGSINDFSTIQVGTTGQDLFNDFWSRLSSRFKNYTNVIIGQMNEPSAGGITAAQWQASAASNVNAIRAAGANNLILLAGQFFDGAHDWTTNGNSTAWHGYNSDPANNFMFEMHQYLDQSNFFQGSSPIADANGSTILAAATAWLVTEGRQCLLTEFGFAPASWKPNPASSMNWLSSASSISTNGITQGGNLMSYMTSNSTQWPGWTFFSGGTVFGGNPPTDGAYAFDIDPTVNGSNNGFQIPIVDQTQMSVLVANL